MRILFALKNFHQEWGGAPESVRLMARQLATRGVSSDVYDAGTLHKGVERLDVLPRKGEAADRFPLDDVGRYAALLQVGPWQSFAATARLLSRLQPGQPLFYLPRGGLADIEFRGPRGLKKRPYFPLFERRFVRRATGVVFSSATEQRETSRLAGVATPQWIVPDFFEPPAAGPEKAQGEGRRPRRGAGEKVTFGFLAEIGPRKGLVPFLRAFASWAAERNLTGEVRLLVAGGLRPGSEAYYAEARTLESAAGLETRFIGPVRHEEREAFYDQVDIFAVPSLFESYCLAALEALGAGCSLLAAPNLGVLEFIPRHAQVTVMRSSDARAMAEALEESLQAFREAPQRAEMRDWATTVIAQINQRAHHLWSELLGLP